MKKNKIGLVLVLLISAVVLSGCNNKPKEVVVESNQLGEKSLADLLGLGEKVKCSMKVDEEEKMEAVVYVSGKKFKQEMKTEGQEITVLSDGEWMYMWNSMMPKTGTKMKLEELKNENSGGGEPVSGNVDMDKKFKMECVPWNAGANDFAIPAGVEFKDATAEMNKLQEKLNSEEFKQDTCSLCDKAIDAESIRQCREQMGCQ